jgi:hypothetical protein
MFYIEGKCSTYVQATAKRYLVTGKNMCSKHFPKRKTVEVDCKGF